MGYITAFLIVMLSCNSYVSAQSSLLEGVKRNPNEAVTLCKRLKTLNSKGISSNSEEVINQISKEKNLTARDAEILTIYVVGMYCPEIT